MPIDNQLFCARARIYNTGLPFLKQTLNVSQNVSMLLLVLLCLLVANRYLRSLKINISSSVMIGKSFNSCIDLCNYLVTICISITSILTNQVLLKSGDIETNPGTKRSSTIKFHHRNLNGLAAHDFVRVPLSEALIIAHNFVIV